MMKRFAIPALACMLIATACNSTKQITAQQAPQIDGRWTIKMVDHEPVDVQDAFIGFEAAKQHLYGNAGCNSFNGSITFDDDSLKIGMMLATKMYCPDNTLENTMLRLLTNSSWKLRLQENQLTMSNPSSTILLEKTTKD
ncbi:META domain-containing protein [Mangrovibacterium marinum]|uniref:Heat shock protein HslJ n=1 Tax=Mangrovibacterium marinum TaxID=1639118 RepID=A0A2T5C1Q1_9BACT|nr:META domain-containing protein [Mangrovibacterium marinum]PTN08596.1 heat shock protein HslJ [Mangrovibacterium marinum]